MEFVTFLSNHPQYACAILVILMMMKSAPVIGFFIPGTFILPLLGAMTASSNNSFCYLFICAGAGALILLVVLWLLRYPGHYLYQHYLKKHSNDASAKKWRAVNNILFPVLIFLHAFF